MVLPWESQELTYREFGSFRFSPEQRAAYHLVLDVEILSYAGEVYTNKKSNPDYGFWGYATVFEGSTIARKVGLEFPKSRLISVRNEAPLLLATIITVGQTEISYDIGSEFFPAPDPGLGVSYTPANVTSIPTLAGFMETVVKVETIPLCQFKFRCFWLPIPEPLGVTIGPVEGNDPTEGEEEYPEPEKKPSDNPFDGNPEESPFDENNDSRDYGAVPQGDPTNTDGSVIFSVLTRHYSGNTSTNTTYGPYEESWQFGMRPYDVRFAFSPDRKTRYWQFEFGGFWWDVRVEESSVEQSPERHSIEIIEVVES